MNSRVSSGVSRGQSSRRTMRPRWRIVGGTPAVRWRSDARRFTTSRRISEYSMATGARSLYRHNLMEDESRLDRLHDDASDFGDRPTVLHRHNLTEDESWLNRLRLRRERLRPSTYGPASLSPARHPSDGAFPAPPPSPRSPRRSGARGPAHGSRR